MNGELFRLSLQSIQRKRRSSLLLFAVLLLSFAFALISLTVTGSMQKTNEEYRYDVYGEWYGAIPNGWDADEAFLREQPWLDGLGITKSYGTIQVSTSGSTGIGVMDEAFLRIGRIGLQDGRFPESANEIAMEADLLSALGYDYTLGQEITFAVAVPAVAYVKVEGSDGVEAQHITVPVAQTYTLCGVLREYADLWGRGSSYLGMPPLCSAMITQPAAEVLWQSAQEAAEITRADMNGAMEEGSEVTGIELDALVPQYYFSVLTGLEGEAKENANRYMDSTRRDGGTILGDREIKINTLVVTAGDREEDIEIFFAAVILTITLLAVVCIYAIRVQDETRQLAIFRSIGITKRQLCVMLLYETLCLGVPAMVLGTGAGALGTGALLRLAVYSGSAPIQVVVPPALLAAAAALWLLGVLAARLAVFLVALRAPLTGRFHMARKRAKRYRNLQRVLIASLFALLCAAIIFTVLESLEPLSTVRYMSSLPDYIVYRKGDFYYPNSTYYFSRNDTHLGYFDTDMTVSKDTAVPISQIPGVAHAWGWGEEYVRLEFDGMEDIPLVASVKEDIEKLAHTPGELPFGIGPYDSNALPVWLVVVDEGDWKGVIDFDIDMDKFRSGDAVLLSFSLGSGGKVVASHNYYSSMKEYEQTGLSVGDTIRITAGSPKVYATVETQVGGIITYGPNASKGGLFGLSESYTIICSEAFLDKLLDALGPDEPWNEFRQGTPYGYEQLYVYTNQSAEYLSTDAVLAALCAREDLQLNSERELRDAWTQQSMQTLILLIPGGGCVALVLLLILVNTLSMEAERQKRNFGILQALGMSRRQLRMQQLGTAVGRGVLGALAGWLAYGGYCVVYALREQVRRVTELGVEPEEVATVQRIIAQKLSEITRYWGDWQVLLPLTALCVILILAVSWLAKRRLMKEDLMAKLRDEH